MYSVRKKGARKRAQEKWAQEKWAQEKWTQEKRAQVKNRKKGHTSEKDRYYLLVSLHIVKR